MTGRLAGIRCRWAVLAALVVLSATARGDGPRPNRAVSAGDDLTFRPTVIVVRGTSQGSGTVIASIPGETLVLTAAHVVDSVGDAFIEVHRYNLGLETKRGSEGWPKKVPAMVIATDPASDVAVLRVEGFQAMPYVARVLEGLGEPESGSVVTSVGVDRGVKLSGWPTRIVEVASIDMEKGGGVRPFLLTETAPDFGRSGGGLFSTDGAVVGVCVGRAEVVKGRRVGVFTSTASVRRLLREHHLDFNISRSVARRLPRNGPVERTRNSVPPPPVPTPRPPIPRTR